MDWAYFYTTSGPRKALVLYSLSDPVIGENRQLVTDEPLEFEK